MTNQPAKQQNNEVTMPDAQVIENLALKGDLSGLSNEQKVQYYNSVCNSLGLNPLTNPFQIIKLQGKETLYAKKDATDQLRRLYGVSVIDQRVDSSFEKQGIYMVTVTLKDKHGRTDTGTGAVNINGAKGDNLANAVMKATTKAKRRGTLSICGLGILDESETDTIPDAHEKSIQSQENSPVVHVDEEKEQSESELYADTWAKLLEFANKQDLDANAKEILTHAYNNGLSDNEYQDLRARAKEYRNSLPTKEAETVDVNDNEKSE